MCVCAHIGDCVFVRARGRLLCGSECLFTEGILRKQLRNSGSILVGLRQELCRDIHARAMPAHTSARNSARLSTNTSAHMPAHMSAPMSVHACCGLHASFCPFQCAQVVLVITEPLYARASTRLNACIHTCMSTRLPTSVHVSTAHVYARVREHAHHAIEASELRIHTRILPTPVWQRRYYG